MKRMIGILTGVLLATVVSCSLDPQTSTTTSTTVPGWTPNANYIGTANVVGAKAFTYGDRAATKGDTVSALFKIESSGKFVGVDMPNGDIVTNAVVANAAWVVMNGTTGCYLVNVQTGNAYDLSPVNTGSKARVAAGYLFYISGGSIAKLDLSTYRGVRITPPARGRGVGENVVDFAVDGIGDLLYSTDVDSIYHYGNASATNIAITNFTVAPETVLGHTGAGDDTFACMGYWDTNSADVLTCYCIVHSDGTVVSTFDGANGEIDYTPWTNPFVTNQMLIYTYEWSGDTYYTAYTTNTWSSVGSFGGGNVFSTDDPIGHYYSVLSSRVYEYHTTIGQATVNSISTYYTNSDYILNHQLRFTSGIYISDTELGVVNANWVFYVVTNATTNWNPYGSSNDIEVDMQEHTTNAGTYTYGTVTLSSATHTFDYVVVTNLGTSLPDIVSLQ